MAYYLCVTFLCWLFGGFIGLHHFYLGRDRHGFLWATTFGGFVIGWARDLWRLKKYTDDANNNYINCKNPSICRDLTRIVGMLFIGIIYRGIFTGAVPEDLPSDYLYSVLVIIAGTLGTALGVYLTANVAHIECDPLCPLGGSFIGELLFGHVHLIWEDTNRLLLVLCAIVTTIPFWKKREQPFVRRSYRRRLLIWGSLGLLFCLLWVSFLYFNAEVYVEELDEDVKLRDVVRDMLNSPEWKEFMDTLRNLIKTLWDTGGDYEKTWFLLKEGMASSLIQNALETFGYDRFTNTEEISESTLNKKYRALVREWHPDKHRSEDKEHAQEKFIEIEKAHKTLKSAIKRHKPKKIEL